MVVVAVISQGLVENGWTTLLKELVEVRVTSPFTRKASWRAPTDMTLTPTHEDAGT